MEVGRGRGDKKTAEKGGSLAAPKRASLL